MKTWLPQLIFVVVTFTLCWILSLVLEPMITPHMNDSSGHADTVYVTDTVYYPNQRPVYIWYNSQGDSIINIDTSISNNHKHLEIDTSQPVYDWRMFVDSGGGYE